MNHRGTCSALSSRSGEGGMARRVDIRRWILPDPQLSDPAWYL